MRTALKLGPADHDRPLTLEEYEAADYAPGHKYELIFGRLEVSPLPDQPLDFLEKWLLRRLLAYSDSHPAVINHVTDKARVFIQGHDEVSAPEPDLVAYHEYPLDEADTVPWQDLRPILVVEILDPERPGKDLVRNPDVYILATSIREYWVLDTRPGAREPELIVHKRHGRRWRVSTIPFNATYTTKLLPGFELLVNPRG